MNKNTFSIATGRLNEGALSQSYHLLKSVIALTSLKKSWLTEVQTYFLNL